MQQSQSEVSKKALRAVENIYAMYVEFSGKAKLSDSDKNDALEELVDTFQLIVDSELATESNLDVELDNLMKAKSDQQFMESLSEVIEEFKYNIALKLGKPPEEIDFSEQQLSSMISPPNDGSVQQDELSDSDALTYIENEAILELYQYALIKRDDLNVEFAQNISQVATELAQLYPELAKDFTRLKNYASKFIGDTESYQYRNELHTLTSVMVNDVMMVVTNTPNEKIDYQFIRDVIQNMRDFNNKIDQLSTGSPAADKMGSVLPQATRQEIGLTPTIPDYFSEQNQSVHQIFADQIAAIQATQRIAYALETGEPYYQESIDDLETAFEAGLLRDERVTDRFDKQTLSKLNPDDIKMALENGLSRVSNEIGDNLARNITPTVNDLVSAIDLHAESVHLAMNSDLGTLDELIKSTRTAREVNYKQANDDSTRNDRRVSLITAVRQCNRLLDVLEPIFNKRVRYDYDQQQTAAAQPNPFKDFERDYSDQYNSGPEQSSIATNSGNTGKGSISSKMGSHRSRSTSSPQQSWTKVPLSLPADIVIEIFKEIDPTDGNAIKNIMTEPNVKALMEANLLDSEYGQSSEAAEGVVANVKYYVRSDNHGPQAAYKYLKTNMEKCGVDFSSPAQESQVNFDKK